MRFSQPVESKHRAVLTRKRPPLHRATASSYYSRVGTVSRQVVLPTRAYQPRIAASAKWLEHTLLASQRQGAPVMAHRYGISSCSADSRVKQLLRNQANHDSETMFTYVPEARQ